MRYGDNYDRNLGFHVDDSLITINLCLKNDSKGSELCFSGIRCPLHIDTPSMKNEKKIITHEKGFAVIHDGKNRHHTRIRLIEKLRMDKLLAHIEHTKP